MTAPALSFCQTCGKLTDFCNCDLQKFVGQLTLLEDKPEPCSICKEQEARKYGVCFDCLEEYDLNGGKPVFVEEATLPEDDIETQLQDVLAEESSDSYEEADDTDDWFNGLDDDFDDSDPDLEDDEDLSDDWNDDEDDEEEDPDDEEFEKEQDLDVDESSDEDSEPSDDDVDFEDEDFDDES